MLAETELHGSVGLRRYVLLALLPQPLEPAACRPRIPGGVPWVSMPKVVLDDPEVGAVFRTPCSVRLAGNACLVVGEDECLLLGREIISCHIVVPIFRRSQPVPRVPRFAAPGPPARRRWSEDRHLRVVHTQLGLAINTTNMARQAEARLGQESTHASIAIGL